jgi:hypothetical protein
MTESPEVSSAGPSGAGTVVLNLGADTGALVLFTPADLDGAEIEISRSGERRTHSQVRRRDTHTATSSVVPVWAAVYPDLAAGDYTIWRADGTVAATVTITGAIVTNCHWPS